VTQAAPQFATLPFATLADRARTVCAAATSRTTDNGQPFLLVPAADLPALAQFLRDDAALRFDALMDLTGFDLLKYPKAETPNAIAVLYLLFSYRHRHRLQLRVLAPRELCTVPTVSAIWPAALYFEREVFDLLGVTFTGHPSLQRIMNPTDWEGHPLRKDYVYPDAYHGVAHLREGQHFETNPPRAGDPPPPAAAPKPPGGHA
jgi:NADH-quinone oxidoreductase subunit C